MKAAPFDYVRPATVTEAVAALAEAGDDAKVLAGGQSLVPVLAMRLGRPTLLVDINAVEGLDDLSLTGDTLHVGATVRQRRVEHDPAAAAVPLLAMALPWIGHRELRSRGTVCGSLAHADPAAELPAVAACLNATLEIAAPSGRRTVHARDFFLAPLTTVLAPDELLLAAHFPAATPGDGFAFAELSRRHGDYALTGVAVRVTHTPSGEVQRAVLAAFAISSRPVVIDITNHLTAALASSDPSPHAPAEPLVRALTEPMAALADELVDTPGDMHASTAYRRRLFTHLAARELANAHLRAKADPVREPTGVRSSPGGSRTSSPPAPRRRPHLVRRRQDMPSQPKRRHANDRQRQPSDNRGAPENDARRRAARPARAYRHAHRLRARHLRHVHGAGRRPGGPVLPAVRLSARRSRSADCGGPGPAGGAAPAAAGVRPPPRAAVRLLHARLPAQRLRPTPPPARGEAGRARRGAVRRAVPLHRLPEHPQRRRRGRPHPPRRPSRPAELRRHHLTAPPSWSRASASPAWAYSRAPSW